MATGAGLMPGDVDAFLRTEVELSKAKRQYATLEKRLDEERTGFSKDFRKLNEQLLCEREKRSALQGRVLELEQELHKERISRFSREEEELSKRKVLEDELKRYKAKAEASLAVLEEELRTTRASWSRRLSEERSGWQAKAIEKAESLQGQVEQTREYYKAQLEAMHREMADLLGTHRAIKEELEVTSAELREERRKKKIIKMELEESKDKYRRCLHLASDLVALRKARTTAAEPLSSYVPRSSSSTARPWSSTAMGGGAISSSSREEEAALLRKQLNLTQVLLEEELKRNRELRDQIAGTSTTTTVTMTWMGRAEG